MARSSCRCGAVRYRVGDPLRPVIACHRAQCRKTSGHSVAATSALGEALAIEGAVRWCASSYNAWRGFCAVCGANLTIFAGSFDDDPGGRLAGYIHCADTGGYCDIADGLPQEAGRDPALTTQVTT